MSEIVITRILDVPRKTAFDAWTQPEQLKKWWGPKDYTCPSAKFDLRVGGEILLAMRDAKGKDIWGRGEIKELSIPEHFVATDTFADAEGNEVSPTHYGMAEWPHTTLWDVTFEEQGPKKTKLTLRHKGIPEGKLAQQCEAGWNQSLDKLERLLGGRERATSKNRDSSQPHR